MKGSVILYAVSVLLALFWCIALALNALFTFSKPSPWLIIFAAIGFVLAKFWSDRIKKARAAHG